MTSGGVFAADGSVRGNVGAVRGSTLKPEAVKPAAMATIFVAYGGTGREAVLGFAAERAAASGDDLLVYHVQESAEETSGPVQSEIEAVMDGASTDVAYEVAIERREAESDETNVSQQKRLIDAVTDPDREFTYAVMGEVERGPIESITLPSMTEAVLETRSIPVVLVPV